MKSPSMKGIGETWETKLERSIADAQKIARRHSLGDCDSARDQIKAHRAALRLIAILNAIKARRTVIAERRAQRP